MKLLPGLVSVTFRKLTPAEIVDLCVKAGVAGIEWGGDVHVPHGDLKTAREVTQRTSDAGLKVASYGSYYRCEGDFAPVLDTALTLDTPVIRVWAGTKASADASEAYREEVAAQTREAVRLCKEAGVSLAFEYHDNTLTDTFESAKALLEAAPGALTYFQPPSGLTLAQCADALTFFAPRVPRLHVFSWRGSERMPLKEGEAVWKKLFPLATHAEWALLEFVVDNQPQQFIEDAATLRAWLEIDG